MRGVEGLQLGRDDRRVRARTVSLLDPAVERAARERGIESWVRREAVRLREPLEVAPPLLGNGQGIAEILGVERLHEREAQRVRGLLPFSHGVLPVLEFRKACLS